MAKDNRIKACPNECKIKKKLITYKADDSFCRKCGSELVLVCAECFCRIEDIDASHRICVRCEEKHEERKQKVKQGLEKGKGAVVAVAAAAPAVIKYAKDPKVKKAVQDGIKLIVKK